ncbi:putative polyamine oxidase 5 [Nicotiana tabacum]|uniref:Polyamine oxidase 5 n=1 Tax=Nicotiana tabacum TaxID=4097 RepID=A0A1S3YNP5_TOBAC|nr:PREDICTED: probable polyamine oxidase 5 [Nicotiana tabacum]
MVTQKPKIVIIGAGISGLTAAKTLYTTQNSNELFELCVVEGGNRIGGRIFTSEFNGDQIEMGATWIHGIEGNPIYKIAQEINSLESEKPWECKEGKLMDKKVTITEDGYEVNSSLVKSISNFFNKMLAFSSGEGNFQDEVCKEIVESINLENGSTKNLSTGSFLRKGLEFYWNLKKDQENVEVFDKWSRKSLEEGVFAMFENIHRHYSSAGDLGTLDFNGESQYCNFPGDELTIAKGYSTVVESLASVLPSGLIQLGRKVTKIEWQNDDCDLKFENGDGTKPVKLHFSDGSVMYADHVIVTVSLGVLKQGIRDDFAMFSPQLPSFKTQAISRLGFGVVDKLFLQLSPSTEECGYEGMNFPYLQMVFHQSDAKLFHSKIPLWIRRTALIHPLYPKSSTLVSWFTGKEALEMETLDDEEIIDGVSTTISQFLANSKHFKNSDSAAAESCVKFSKVLKCKWGTDPLFLGSYTHIAVGSSGDDLDVLAEPLPKVGNYGKNSKNCPPLQILFAGEATHRCYYSTTHGAYLTGVREANRLLKHFQCVDI